MTTKELQTMIALGEGHTQEFKESFSGDIGQQLCAFDEHWFTTTFKRTTTTSKTTSKKTSKNSSNDAEELILKTMKENPEATAQHLAQLLSVTEAGVRYHIKNLKKKGAITREGGPKTGRWVVKQ